METLHDLLAKDSEQACVVVVDARVARQLAQNEGVFVDEAEDLEDSVRELLHLARELVDNDLETVQDAEQLFEWDHSGELVKGVVGAGVIQAD